MHLKRLVVAALVVPLLYLYVTRLPAVFFLALLALIAVLAQKEFYAMYGIKGGLPLLGVLSGLVILFFAYILGSPPSDHSAAVYPVIFMLSFMVIAAARLFSVRTPASALADIAPVVTGIVYIPTLLLPQWFLRLEGYEWILFLYGCVWSSDSLAYYVGKGIGRRKLYKEMSPNKTVEGGFGSVAGGIIAAMILGKVLFRDIQVPALAGMGAAIGAITIVGDLVESMFKRDAGVKDSGSLFPGHGGILDKIDGVLFASPALFLIKLII